MSGRTGQCLAGICAVGLVLRLLLVLPTGDSEGRNPDAVEYLAIANNVATGHGYSLGKDFFDGGDAYGEPVPTAWCLPGYTLLLAGIQLAAGDGVVTVAKAVNAFIGALSCLLVFVAARAAFSTSAGLWAAAGVAIYPPFILFAGDVATETLAVAMLSGTVALALYWEGAETPLRAAVLGCVIGIACLVRPVPAFLLAALLLHHVLGKRPLRERLAQASLLLVGFAIAVAPWITRNALTPHGRPALTSLGELCMWMPIHWAVTGESHAQWNINTYARSGDDIRLADLSEWDRDRYFGRVWREYVREHPGPYLRIVFNNVRGLWKMVPGAAYYPLRIRAAVGVCSLLLCALALTGALTGRAKAGHVRLLVVYIALVTLAHVPLWSVMRYRISEIDPVLIILAGQGAAWYVGRLRRRAESGGDAG